VSFHGNLDTPQLIPTSKAPVLVLHGANDPVVPLKESASRWFYRFKRNEKRQNRLIRQL
jgi:predicted esterase